VFLLLGGVQLFLSTQLSLIDFEISFGPEGFLAVLLPVLLLLCGVLLWVTPQYRHFYSIIGTLTAVYSLLGLNLGGWFLGMLFGIVGGALGFAWTPVTPAPGAPDAAEPSPGPEPEAGPEPEPEPEPEADPDRPTAELPAQLPAGTAGTGPLTDQPPGQDQIAPVRAPRPDPRSYAALSLPLLMIGTLAGAALPATPADHCLIPIPVLCWHEPEPEPEPAGTPTPTPTPSGSPSPTGPPAPEPGPDPTGEPSAPDPPGGPGPTATPDPTPTPTPVPTLDPPPDVPLVSANPALMTADRLTQENFRFEGITELPTASGPIEVLKFSFTRSTATNFALAATTDGGDTTLVTADPLVISGDVTFYTSRFQGRLFGVLPLELTPDSPLVDLLELVGIPLPVVFTDVSLDLVFTQGAELTATGFALRLPTG
jgi:hypothetical protein